MKYLRLPKAMLLRIRFPVILMLFVAMMVLNERSISSISHSIGMQLFSSARFEEATRAEMELSDLISQSYRYSRGDSAVSREDLSLALDIFWSRATVLATRSYTDEFAGANVRDLRIVPELVAALPALERAITMLRSGDEASFAGVGDFASRFQARVIAFSDWAYVSRRNIMNKMVVLQRDNLQQLKWLQIENAIFALLTFLYVLFELFISRRLNRALKNSVEEKKKLLISDHLTGICNRLHFEMQLHRHSLDAPFSVIYLDLDGFKAINDTRGHAAGDYLLKHVATVLDELAGPEDVVSRLGGDEFAVLLEGSRERAGEFSRLAIERIAAPVDFEGCVLEVSASAGISHSTDLPAGAATATLMINADMALYAAKAAGRNCMRFLTHEIMTEGNRKLYLDADFKTALLDDLIDMAYQPIVSLTDGFSRGFEALVRWNHPVFGDIPAPEIVFIAEKTKQIVPLTLYMLDRSCAVRNSLALKGFDLQVTVNVPPKLLSLPELGGMLADITRKHRIEPGKLLLELTEDAIMDDTTVVERNLKIFRSLGVDLAVDDFGKGYSNLSRLANLDFRKIKLDKSLIDRIATSARSRDIAQSISRMAADMNIYVIAEGVETREQRDILCQLGIPLAQGFYYSRPMTALALFSYLDGTLRSNADPQSASLIVGNAAVG